MLLFSCQVMSNSSRTHGLHIYTPFVWTFCISLKKKEKKPTFSVCLITAFLSLPLCASVSTLPGVQLNPVCLCLFMASQTNNQEMLVIEVKNKIAHITRIQLTEFYASPLINPIILNDAIILTLMGQE